MRRRQWRHDVERESFAAGVDPDADQVAVVDLAREVLGNRQAAPIVGTRCAVARFALCRWRGRIDRPRFGRRRPLPVAADIIVVTPYNAQVSCLRRVLADRCLENIEVGTVDKFQGREAYVVFFLTAASPEDAPRGMSFVFDRQRFNVAISRARALAVMVGSPTLLVHRCTSVEHVQVANGLCRFIEESAIRYADHQ
jgi:hypothetical protein